VVHQYKNNGYDIVLDVNSGAIHVVDDVTYDVIEMYAARENVADTSAEEIVTALSGKYGKEEVEEAIDEVQTLIKNEELFTKDTYENYMMDFKKRPTVVKALCLHIAHDCNLACRYCFAEEGEYHGRRALMSFETGKKALDFLIANSGNRRNLEVDFFGGEPLMNWQVVKDLVAYGREQEKIHNKNFRFTLTTNGVLLNDEIMEFANKEMGNVVLSIDGRKEVHDHMRPFRKGAGSYDLIVPKFQQFAEPSPDFLAEFVYLLLSVHVYHRVHVPQRPAQFVQPLVIRLVAHQEGLRRVTQHRLAFQPVFLFLVFPHVEGLLFDQ
jgi:uncharacterized protein